VLVVDDDPLQLGLIIELLEFEGVRADGAGSAAEALEKIAASEIAVVVLDLRLPDGEGSDLIQRVLAAAPRSRVIINTGFAELETAKDAVNLGAYAYLEKGRDASELVVATLRGLRDYAESRMATAQRKLESIAQHAPDLIAEVARDGTVVRSNRPTAEGDRTLAGLLPPCLDGLPHADQVRRCVEAGASGGTVAFECAGPNPRGEGERVYDCRLGRVASEDGSDAVEAVLIARDVTDARAAAEELRRRDEQLRQSRKMEAIGSLAGGVAHDFNNLVLAMKAFAKLAAAELPEDHPAAAHIERIGEATEQAGAITQALLTYTRKRPLQRARVDLSEVIERTVAITRRVIPANIELRADLAPRGTAVVIGDDSRVQQVVMNLTVNARDAMRSGGVLSVTTDVERAADAGADGDDTPARGWATLRVGDTGIGMAPQVLDRVFEPYFTTKTREQGTGLGLAIIQGVVEELGGTIEAESEPGRGSVFTVRFPLAPPAETDAHEPGDPADNDPDEPKRTLGGRAVVVCPGEHVRRVLTLMLGSLGYAVEQFASEAEAKSGIDAALPPDVVIVDAPAASGVADPGAGDEPSGSTGIAGAPVVAIVDDGGARLAGAASTLTRPFNRRDLEAAVRAAVDAGASHG